jgi:succinyl-diaminopimelate desuccinylase
MNTESEIKERVIKRIDTMEKEAIRLLSDLVKADSVNPPGDTRRAMDVILGKTKSFTENYDVVSSDDIAPNIFITINPGARPQLLYNGHLDTVPIGDEKQWNFDPFGAQIVDNRMYGRGVADMKGGVAAMLMAAKVLESEKIPFQGSLILNFVSDEETGGTRGMRYLMEKDLYSPDMVVVGEITNRNGIAIAEKGAVTYNLTTKGRTAHASTPWVGVNAIEKMVKILYRLNMILSERLKMRPSGILPPATMNIGMIKGGIASNIVPDKCSVRLDRRILPGESIESVTKEIQDVIDEVKQEDGDIETNLRVLGSGAPFETSPSEMICQIAKKTLEELKLPSEFVGFEQVSDGRFFAEKGVPTILIGPGIAKQAHTPDESLELDQYLEAIKIYSLLAINALGIIER